LFLACVLLGGLVDVDSGSAAKPYIRLLRCVIRASRIRVSLTGLTRLARPRSLARHAATAHQLDHDSDLRSGKDDLAMSADKASPVRIGNLDWQQCRQRPLKYFHNADDIHSQPIDPLFLGCSNRVRGRTAKLPVRLAVQASL